MLFPPAQPWLAQPRAAAESLNKDVACSPPRPLLEVTPAGFARGCLPKDGDLSPAALVARATGEMHVALFARDTLNPPPPRGCTSCPRAPLGSAPKAIGFPGGVADVETDPQPQGSTRVKGKLH